jgi:predicted nucleic acid-binding protein
LSSLRGAVIARGLTAQRAEAGLREYVRIALVRHGHESLLMRMLQLRHNFSAYDATYVALAEQLDAELLTADQRLARAVRAHTNVQVA